MRYLLDAADPTKDILKDLSERDLRGEAQEVYSLDLPWKKSWAADWIQEKGYGLTEELKPSKSRDQHRYVTGIRVPEDVLALFRKIYAPEADPERRKRYLVKECCELARSCYETAPADLVLEICNMDDVEEQKDEKMSMAVWFFMDDNTVSDLLEDQEEITLSVTEEAKENLIRILEECRSQTNKRCYMGHMSLEDLEKRRREVRQKA